jgi:transcriptional regulator with GAF, ATPase, and Fis domain
VALRARVLFGAARLAEARDDGARSAAWDAERAPLAALLTAHAPAGRYDPAAAPWLVAPRTLAQKAGDAAVSIGRLDAFAQIVRLLEGAGSLRELLGRVLDALLLWTRAERGAVLLPAPDDRLVARVRRHLDLGQGTQQALSYGLARRAIAQGDVVVATDAFADLGNLHASVHALRLRSVLAVPLLARGRTYGVVYLDDKRQKQLFGPEEIAWVRLLATQAALAVADAHERAVLARAHRRAEKRGSALSALVAAKDEALRAAEAAVAAARGDEEGALIGTSRPMQALRARLRRVAAAEIPVLILGESGTGKELVARGVHDGSPRRLRPFVSENCGAIPEGLLESTLFGHIRGAFTGATANRPGLFERADGGTLFLDEIAELPLAMQAKLLRVLQDGEVRPVGSDRSRRVNVRLVAATHRDLPARVAAGLFREDLLYRIDVVRLDVPPLRERLDDVPLLVAHFLAKYQQPGETPRAITTTALAALARRAWPGNVRQLENDVRRLLVLADATITLDALGEEPPPSSLGPQAAPHPATLPGEDLDLRGRVDDLERVLVAEALRRTAGNQTRAALLLGVSRFGLQKMQKRLGF